MEFGEAEVVGGNFKVTWRLPLEPRLKPAPGKVNISKCSSYIRVVSLCRGYVLFLQLLLKVFFIYFFCEREVLLWYTLHQGMKRVLKAGGCFVCFKLCVLFTNQDFHPNL